jgi:hypothetical protein
VAARPEGVASARLRIWHNAEFRLEQPRASLVLAFCRDPVAGPHVGVDQVPLCALAQRIEANQARSGRDRRARVARDKLALDQSLQGLHEPAAQCLAAEERPFLEVRAAFDRQALQEVSGIEPQRLVQLAGNARGLERVRIDAGLDRWRESERGAVCLDHVNGEGDTNLMQRAPQPAARCLRVGLGPQQARHVVAANRRARIRQVRNKAQAFAQGEIDATPVKAQGGESEELNLQVSHHEPLILQMRAGDGPGTRAPKRIRSRTSCARDIGASNDILPSGDKGRGTILSRGRSRRADPAAALQLGIERRLAAGHEPSRPGLSRPGP